MLRGRDFNSRDTETSLPVVIINQTLAHRFFGNKNPVGANLSIVRSPQPQGDPQQLAPGSVEIVGVVGNVKHWFVGGDPHDDSEIYVPFSQRAVPTMTLVARVSDRSRQALAAAIHDGVMALDKNLPLYASETMRQQLSETIAPRRFYPLLLGMFDTNSRGQGSLLNALMLWRLPVEKPDQLVQVLREGFGMLGSHLCYPTLSDSATATTLSTARVRVSSAF